MKIIFTFICVFFTATGFAAPKEKTSVCHVGNEVGPKGEVYLDDPGCVPIEDNGYFCPDAGKIDLIEVPKPNKHLNNPSHQFDELSDYLPGDVGASGVGNEDSNGDGVDEGCAPPTNATCPCDFASMISAEDPKWQPEVVFESWDLPYFYCRLTTAPLSGSSYNDIGTYLYSGDGKFYCDSYGTSGSYHYEELDTIEEYYACSAAINAYAATLPAGIEFTTEYTEDVTPGPCPTEPDP